jgi:hypothetical protein
MKVTTLSAAALVAAICATSWLPFPQDARANVVLDGAVIYDGANDGIGLTNSTVPGGYRLYISLNSPTSNFINAPDSTISYNLSLGTTVFYMFGFLDLPLAQDSGYGPLEPTFGLNLFINDAPFNFLATPELSGTTASNYGSGPNFSSTSLSATTPGSLAYTIGNLVITLTDFNFKIPSDGGTGFNLVSAFSPTPDTEGTDNLVGEFTLNVSAVPGSAVPEPSTWAMLALGFTCLGSVGYRRAKAGHTTTPA